VDAACLIDLWRSTLLGQVMLLHHLAVALPVWHCSNLSIIPQSVRDELRASGFEVVDLDGSQCTRAIMERAKYPALAPEECFSLILAGDRPQAFFAATDPHLRTICEKHFQFNLRTPLWLVDNAMKSIEIPEVHLAHGLSVCRRRAALTDIADLIEANLRSARP